MLGGAVERSFKAELMVQQHSFPPPNVASGSFVADIDLGLGHDWDPTCMKMDESLYSVAEKCKNFVAIYLVDITQVCHCLVPSSPVSQCNGFLR